MLYLKLENEELLVRTKDLAIQERKIQADFLQHLLEIDNRKLFLEIGFGSLFDYVTQELGYSESSAYRRIQAMRLLKAVPELESKIAEGRVNLTTAAQVQSHIRAEAKRGIETSVEERAQLVRRIENQSTRDVEKHLLSLKPTNSIPEEKVRQVTESLTEIRMVIPEEMKLRLDQLKLQFSHVNPDMSYQELYDYLSLKIFDQLQLKQKKTISGNQHKATPAPEPTAIEKSTPRSARYIPASVRKAVWTRDEGCCSFVDHRSKKRCNSRFQIQEDHIQPVALGGDNSLENLRLLCANHNRWRAEKTFGQRPSKDG